ncbi:MAG: hypothetical protein IPN49_00945 [Saprospiraceae bacterium]|nr:hypothetical protein [Saprospiraceae bacterium]
MVYSFQKVNESEYELTLFSAHEGMFNGLQFALNFNNFEIVDIKGHQLPVDEEDFVLNNNIFFFEGFTQ